MEPPSTQDSTLAVDTLVPIPPLSQDFLRTLDIVSDMAVGNALLFYSRVYFSSGGKIILREDQILAGVRYHERQSVIKIARTGSGKTMQIIIAALMNPRQIILVLSPLLRLQDSMVDEINKDFAGVRAIAINHALRNNFEAWKGIEAGMYNIIITSPEQCKTINGHSTRLHTLLCKNKTWPKQISGVVVDEAHGKHGLDGEYGLAREYGVDGGD
ncbi:hypothetical protein EWM64_g542 [Hericium alpestre]|uniref:DNA 3'-5' helicase n=1 Tax=Hericium alpestre TaxID=135208 RepID=A0A4Z0AAW1_9AGAM|nr:hypothetical protein EWM64_g542 [Hericium alpestre]